MLKFLFDMGKIHFITFRCSTNEREKILKDARSCGYVFLTNYLRSLTLNGNLLVNIYDTVKRIEDKNKIKFKEF